MSDAWERERAAKAAAEREALRQAAQAHDPARYRVTRESAERREARQLLREFLRSVPRIEVGETVALPRTGGGVCVVDRGQLAAEVDALRPRLRQVVLLLYERHWRREDVAKRLLVSLDTVERDQALALDQLITALCGRGGRGRGRGEAQLPAAPEAGRRDESG